MMTGGSTVMRMAALAFLAIVQSMAVAQQFPSKAVNLVVTVPAGGSIDAMARTIAPELARALGQPVLVENRAGASGNIAADFVARAPADGHTLLITSSSTLTLNAHVYKSVPFNPEKSFVPIVMPARLNMILAVHPKMNVSTFPEFVAQVKAQPGKLNFGSSGNATLPHLAGELLMIRIGGRSNHVPYKGIAPALNDLLSGQIDFMFDSASSVPHIKAGKLRALAVVGPNRLVALPDVPTLKELGVPNMEVAGGWYGILAPAGTPRPVVQRLNTEIVRILRTPEVIERINSFGLEPTSSTPEELGAALHDDFTRLGPVVQQIGLKLE